MIITPALLNTTFEDFARDVKKVEGLFSYAQIDVMDGAFVPNTSFTEIDKINTLESSLKWELHLMVAHPLAELSKWPNVTNVFRIIFHAESSDDPASVVAWARERRLEIGVALNPETPLEKINNYKEQLNVVQFMTVHPGHQGNPFLPEVLEKIKAFTNVADRAFCSVDGGVSSANIALLQKAGVDIANVGSTLLKSTDIQSTYTTLESLIKK